MNTEIAKSTGSRLHLLWIYSLTALGGYFNAGAILLHHRPASHHTGNLSGLALAAVEGDVSLILELLGVMLAFLAGSMIAGYLFHDRKFRASKRYGIALLCMGALLVVGVILPGTRYLLFIGAAFMGLQNGLFIFYRNILVRTTHVTGTLTDLGFAMGSFLHGRGEEKRRILYYSCSIFSFFLGSLITPFVLPHGESVFWIAMAVAYFAVALFYVYLRRRNHI